MVLPVAFVWLRYCVRGGGIREWPSAAPFIAAVWETGRAGRIGGIRWRLAGYSDGSWRTGLSWRQE